MERRPAVGASLVLAAAALWGTLGLFGKVLYRYGFTPFELASARASVGLLGLAAGALFRPGTLRVPLRSLPFLAAYGIGGYALFETLYFMAVERTTIAVAAALLYTAPAFVVLLAAVFERERLTPAGLGALGLVLLGVFLVTGAARALLAGQAALSPLAAALGLGSGLMYGAYTLMSKRAMRRFSPVTAVFWVFLFASLALALLAPPWRVAARAPAALPILAAMGLGPTLGAFLLYLAGLRHLPATTASMLATVEPVVAAALGAAFLDERLGLDRLAGVLCIVAAALLLAWSERPRARPVTFGG